MGQYCHRGPKTYNIHAAHLQSGLGFLSHFLFIAMGAQAACCTTRPTASDTTGSAEHAKILGAEPLPVLNGHIAPKPATGCNVEENFSQEDYQEMERKASEAEEKRRLE